jgi:predicted DNA-binding transcriptional regulator AlpA
MEGFLGLNQILGARAVTAADVAANRARMESAKASGRRVAQLPLRTRPTVPALLPISRSGWWQGVKDGKFPAPVRCGGRSLWRASDIQALLDKLGGGHSS